MTLRAPPIRAIGVIRGCLRLLKMTDFTRPKNICSGLATATLRQTSDFFGVFRDLSVAARWHWLC
jgi:hypothetical protein